ncbi:MAG: hypothetical protein ICV63_06830 [Coleofasciculus sp. Co-bin14]|nr:hypothetical protein [Coleofasciculus sp. Co-bin14]
MLRYAIASDQPFKLVDFGRGLAMETIDRGLPVVLFWSEYASLAYGNASRTATPTGTRTLACGNASRT